MPSYLLLKTKVPIQCKYADPYITESVLCELEDKYSCENRNGKEKISELNGELVHICKTSGLIKQLMVIKKRDCLKN
tara:strand:+ start:14597 stop:14827 length:231 start_codon:yes stop_codon:yes gene_type:complete